MPRYLITSALPYINGIKHLGNLAGSMLPADVYARFRRAEGHEVLFICATDEHGTPAELAAEAAGQSTSEYCAQMHAAQQRIGDRFCLSFDWFGRSHSRENHELTQHFYNQLDIHGLIREASTQQLFSKDDQRFLPDRYVIGTCPHCHYERARGDQCENCTRVLDPTDLIAPRSAISGSQNLEMRASTHLYLKQSALVEQLDKWISSKIGWPRLVTSIARKWLNEGLNDRGITRDLAWGIPVAHQGVARPGLEGKVFYVWFDAPIEYIGATAEWANHAKADWRRWWREDEGAADVVYVQFMGKDNVPFHTVGFPATLFGSGEPWKVVDYIKGFSWLNYYGEKFSTSQRRGLFMNDALDLLPADYWRWYLVANAPESDDASFTWEHFQAVVNHDLADVFGNFVMRVMSFCALRFSSCVPAGPYGALEEDATRALEPRRAALTRALSDMEFRKAAAELRAIWSLGNEYLQKAEPWKRIKTDRAAAAAAIRYALNLAAAFADLARPFIPEASARVAKALGRDEAPPVWPRSMGDAVDRLAPGAAVENPGVLFAKIENHTLRLWAERFGGAKSDPATTAARG